MVKREDGLWSYLFQTQLFLEALVTLSVYRIFLLKAQTKSLFCYTKHKYGKHKVKILQASPKPACFSPVVHGSGSLYIELNETPHLHTWVVCQQGSLPLAHPQTALVAAVRGYISWKSKRHQLWYRKELEQSEIILFTPLKPTCKLLFNCSLNWRQL